MFQHRTVLPAIEAVENEATLVNSGTIDSVEHAPNSSVRERNRSAVNAQDIGRHSQSNT